MSAEERTAFRELGLTDEQIDHHLGAEEPDEDAEPDAYVVWPDNWQALELFISLGNQWQRFIPAVGEFVVWECLPFERVIPYLQLMVDKRKQRQVLLEDLQHMERAALQILNER